MEDKLNELYYIIGVEPADDTYLIIDSLRQLINEEFVHKDRMITSQNLYDVLYPKIIKQQQKAELNGVAYAISVIDKLHTYTGSDLEDAVFKGIKNGIREQFKAETGVDPATSYPLDIKLTVNSNERLE